MLVLNRAPCLPLPPADRREMNLPAGLVQSLCHASGARLPLRFPDELGLLSRNGTGHIEFLSHLNGTGGLGRMSHENGMALSRAARALSKWLPAVSPEDSCAMGCLVLQGATPSHHSCNILQRLLEQANPRRLIQQLELAESSQFQVLGPKGRLLLSAFLDESTVLPLRNCRQMIRPDCHCSIRRLITSR
jgi:hypothetical protein